MGHSQSQLRQVHFQEPGYAVTSPFQDSSCEVQPEVSAAWGGLRHVSPRRQSVRQLEEALEYISPEVRTSYMAYIPGTCTVLCCQTGQSVIAGGCLWGAVPKGY